VQTVLGNDLSFLLTSYFKELEDLADDDIAIGLHRLKTDHGYVLPKPESVVLLLCRRLRLSEVL